MPRRIWFHFGWYPWMIRLASVPFFITAGMLLYVLIAVEIHGSWIPVAVGVVICMALGIFFLVRMGRLGAHLTAERLIIVRTYRTIGINWSDVDRFLLSAHGVTTYAGHVRLADGRLVWIEGIGAFKRFAAVPDGVVDVISEMNKKLPQYRGQASPHPPS